jgi:hypothetical protein
MKRLKALKEDRILNSIAELKAAANACGWSREQLQAIYNAIPGAPPKKRLRNRPTAIEAIWKALPVYDGNSESSKGAKRKKAPTVDKVMLSKKPVVCESNGPLTPKPENGHKPGSWDENLKRLIEQRFDAGKQFTSADVKKFEPFFAAHFPTNTAIAAGLRRTLQHLRDQGFVEFTGRGEYRRV